MLDTDNTIKEAANIWKEIIEENGITEEEIMSSEYDYMDKGISKVQ